MANNFTPVGNEIQVNLAPNQDGPQIVPDVTVLSDGRFFVAFADEGGGDSDIVGQFVNADGSLSGSNIDIDIDAGHQSKPAVAARSGGAAVVVWEDGPTGDIQYAIVSSAGTVSFQQTILDGGGDPDPDVATLSDGRSLVVTDQLNASTDVVFRFIDAAGNPAGVQEFVDNGAAGQFDPVVAAFANNALVVYTDATAGNLDLQARFYNGTSFATEITIADATGDILQADVAALSDGRFIVVWEDAATDDIQARFVSATGVPLGGVFSITVGMGFDFSANVAALPDGGFLVSWTNDGASVGTEVNANKDAVLARRFDAAGAPAGDVFLVNTGDPDTNQSQPAVAANAAGQAFVVWTDGHQFTGEDADPAGIRGHAFLATTDIVNGTAGADIIQTYNLGETIDGLAGDDTINALGGNDIVHGGAGFDHIAGGLGNDQLFGEGGEDLLKGEDGDDVLVGGLGRDVLIGGTGRDTFDFNASAESRVGANHDLVKGFSHAQHDKINLQTIDADTTAGGNQGFDFIGGAGFTGTAGELRLSAGLLLGDTNGNGIADFEIKVTGIGAGATSDFVL